MPFYLLHETNTERKNIDSFKYIYYTSKIPHEFTGHLTFTNEPNLKYCRHQMNEHKIQFDWNDDIIDILTNENILVAKFEKIANHDSFEVWINKKYNDNK